MIELEHVHTIAARNTSRRQMCAGLESTWADMTCPLLSSDDCCLAYGVRPLCCRCSPNELPGRVGADLQRLGQEEGIVKGLATTGLQSGVYELNEALAKVLGDVDMPQRWAAGERVFAE